MLIDTLVLRRRSATFYIAVYHLHICMYVCMYACLFVCLTVANHKHTSHAHTSQTNTCTHTTDTHITCTHTTDTHTSHAHTPITCMHIPTYMHTTNPGMVLCNLIVPIMVHTYTTLLSIWMCASTYCICSNGQTHAQASANVHVYIYVCMCMCMCVYVYTVYTFICT